MLGKFLRRVVEAFDGTLYFPKSVRQRAAFRLARQVRCNVGESQLPVEVFLLKEFAFKSLRVEGDFAEVGVFRGGSAKVLKTVTFGKTKKLHLFDTFKGMPYTSDLFKKGSMACHLEDVEQYVGSYNVRYHEGLFPKTLVSSGIEKLAFVHVDVDTYDSTYNVLFYLYPLLSEGGVVIIHDYSQIDGVRMAVDNYCELRGLTVYELPGSQGLIIKAARR